MGCNTGRGPNNIAMAFTNFTSSPVYAPTGTTTDSMKWLGGKTKISSGADGTFNFFKKTDIGISRSKAVKARKYEKPGYYVKQMYLYY